MPRIPFSPVSPLYPNGPYICPTICVSVSNSNISNLNLENKLSLITHWWSWSPWRTCSTVIAFLTLEKREREKEERRLRNLKQYLIHYAANCCRTHWSMLEIHKFKFSWMSFIVIWAPNETNKNCKFEHLHNIIYSYKHFICFPRLHWFDQIWNKNSTDINQITVFHFDLVTH